MNYPLLSVNSLSKSFGGRLAVDAVSFQVHAGETLGLIGPNGAGKSTTVNMISGLLTADQGEILVAGQPIGIGQNEVKQKIGLVPQDLALYEDMSAFENLKLFGALYGLHGATLASRCQDALALVNLTERARDKVLTFSGGMKRRLNIAAALLHQPQLLILDEPTVGVDAQSRNAIFDCLETIQRDGRSLIYTSHYMEEVERLANRIVIIDQGKVIADETPASLYRRLPSQAALHLDFAELPTQQLLDALAAQAGVASVTSSGMSLSIGLIDSHSACALPAWFCSRGWMPLQFATAKTKLEDIFLALTGRSLRD